MSSQAQIPMKSAAPWRSARAYGRSLRRASEGLPETPALEGNPMDGGNDPGIFRATSQDCPFIRRLCGGSFRKNREAVHDGRPVLKEVAR
jgi:hypothetical protein